MLDEYKFLIISFSKTKVKERLNLNGRNAIGGAW